MNNQEIKITDIESELYQWDKPPIWNGLHVYDQGRLHLVRVRARSGTEEVVGYGFNGGTAATRPLQIFPMYVDEFRPQLIGRSPIDTAHVSQLAKITLRYMVRAATIHRCWLQSTRRVGISKGKL